MTANRMFCGLLLLSAILVAVAAVHSVRLPEGKNWIDLVQAMGTPSVALLAAHFTWKNYQLTRAKRQDELFDRRWKLYCEFKNFWLSTGDGAQVGELGDAPMEILSQYVEEAEVLFGSDVGAAVGRLPEDGHSGGGGRFLEPELAELFTSRMRLEQ